MKTCTKCNSTMFDVDINQDEFCEKCARLDKIPEWRRTEQERQKIMKCKGCGSEIKAAYLSADYLCASCAKNLSIQRASIPDNQVLETDKRGVEGFDRKKVTSYLITSLILTVVVYLIWFFISDQKWCKDGTNNCLESAPQYDDRETNIPYGL